MGRWLSALIGLALMVLPAPFANATMVMPSSLEQMVAGSDAIVIGIVTAKNSYADGNRIYTSVTVEVKEYLKSYGGETPASIELKLLGGTVGTKTMTVDMSPRLDVGDEVALFLKRAGDKYVCYAFYYGVYNIKASKDGQTLMVSGPVYQTGKVYDFTAKTMVLNNLPIGGEALSVFRGRVTSLVAQGEGR